LKHQLSSTVKNCRKCELVISDVKKHCVYALKSMEFGKAKNAVICYEIGMIGDLESEELLSDELESSHASNSQSREFGPVNVSPNNN